MVHPDKVNDVVLLEYSFGLALKSVCALVTQYLSQKMRNHLNTNADFKLATNVGRPDVMILIVRLMDLSTLSSMNRKNLLDANTFVMFKKFLLIQQDGQSLAAYEKRFMDQLTSINSLGALMSKTAEVQLLLNNVWGQVYLAGLSPDYNKMKLRLLEKYQMEYPHVAIASTVEKAKVFHQHLESSNHVFGNKNQNVGANMSTPNASSSNSNPDVPNPTPTTNGKKDKKDKKLLADEKATYVAAAKLKVQVACDARYAQLQSKYDKAVKPASKPLCHICGYNKGHPTHECGMLSTALKAKALVVFNEQKDFRKKNYSN